MRDTWHQWLLCRYRNAGCEWSVQFREGEDRRAIEERKAHERLCRFKYALTH